MVKKKKKNYISIKKQLVVATGIVLILFGLGLFVAWADATMPLKGSSKHVTFSDVTIKGESVCLPHRDTNGPQTEECAQGIKTAGGTYYGISGVIDRNEDNSIEVTGTLKQAAGHGKYIVTGIIIVE